MGKYEDYTNLIWLENVRLNNSIHHMAFEQFRYQLENKYNLRFPLSCYYLSTFAQYFNKQVIGK